MSDYIVKQKKNYCKPDIKNIGKLIERTKAAGGKNTAGSDGIGSSVCKSQGANPDC